MKRSLLFFALLALTSAVLAKDETVWIDLVVPSDSLAIGRADVESILDAQLGKAVRNNRRNTYSSMNKFLNDGFGLSVKKLQYAWFAFSASQGGMMFLQGDFQEKKVIKKMQRRKDWDTIGIKNTLQVSNYKNDYGAQQTASLLRDDLIAMGSRDVMAEVLARWQQGPQTSPRPGVIQIVNSDAQVAAVVLDLTPFQQANPTYSLINNAWLEGYIDNAAHMTISAESLNAQVTQGLEQLLRGLLKVIPNRPELLAQPLAVEALKNAKMQRDGAILNVSTSIPGDLVMTRFPTQRRAL